MQMAMKTSACMITSLVGCLNLYSHCIWCLQGSSGSDPKAYEERYGAKKQLKKPPPFLLMSDRIYYAMDSFLGGRASTEPMQTKETGDHTVHP